MVLVHEASGPDPDAPTIAGDPELLQQAIVNLLENAIRYCPSGSTVRLRSTRSSSDTVSVSVTDDGPGIPSEERERVFRRLYRIAGRSKDKPGTGIGLTLVRAVADLHRATVTLHDADPGLEVRLRFPAGTV